MKFSKEKKLQLKSNTIVKLIIVWDGDENEKKNLEKSLSNNKVAANIGKDAFFEPEIETLPLILQGPLIRNLSINYFLILATWIVVWPWYLPFFDL